MQTRVFQTPGLSAEALAQQVRQWFQANEFETQYFRLPNGSLLVQGYRDDLWRVALGFGAALNVEIRALKDDELEVEIGAGAWGDKIIVAGLGLLLFLPLVLTAAWGTWQQFQLDKDLWGVIESALPLPPELLTDLPTEQAVVPTDLPERWFDETSGEIYALGFFERMESWQRAMADGRIETTELQNQGERVLTLLRELEPSLSPTVHAKLTQALQELAVLQGMQSYALIHKK